MKFGLYGIKRDSTGEWCVYLKRTGEAYFYSDDRQECVDWIERNDSDENR